MSVGTPNELTSGASGTDTTSYTTASVSPGADSVILLHVGSGRTDGTAGIPSSITGALGLTWTQVETEAISTGNIRGTLFWAATNGSPPTGTITINFSGTQHNCTWKVVELDGVNTTTPVVQSDSQNGTSALTSITLPSAITTGSAVLGFAGLNTTTFSLTAGSGYTLVGAEQESTNPTQTIHGEYDLTGTTTVAFGTTGGTAPRYIIGVEIAEFAGATQHPAAGQVDATTATSGATALRAVASGVVAAVTALSGAATSILPATGSVAATSAVSGSATVLKASASGTVAAVSGAVGAVGKLYPAAGQVDAVSGTSATVAARLPTSGSVAATTTAVGATTARLPASGTVAAVTTVSGSASVIGGPQQYPAAGTVAATTDTSGSASLLASASGTVAAVTTVSGSAAAVYVVSGTAAAVTGTAGEAEVQTPGTHQPAHPDRLYAVSAEVRQPAVRNESRVLAVSADLRRSAVRSESRHGTVPDDERGD